MNVAREGATWSSARRAKPAGRVLLAAAVAVSTLLVAASPAASGTGERSASRADHRAFRAGPPKTPVSPSEWTVYHGALDGSGAGGKPADFASAKPAWRSAPLDGALYGEPLEAAGRVVAATEDDTVYALAADSGAVLWSRHLGDPVPSGDLPCGNISPTVGITGTPVIDLSRSEVFAVADELVAGRPVHRLVGLDLYSGKVILDRSVDPPHADSAAMLQRTGLALDRGRVVFGFGGNYGDCGPYHGWVVSVPVKGDGHIRRYEVAARGGDRQGAVWMGGAAPEVVPDGDLWVATGNSAAVSGAYDGSDSVVELSPSLRRVGLFAPSNWAKNNAGDRDLGSTAPALLPDGDILQVGKSSTAFLIRGSRPGGVGGELSSTTACDGTDADGGDAVRGNVVYVACQSGLEAFEAAASDVARQWDAVATVPSAAAVPDKPPIIEGGYVWSIGGDTLYGLVAANGSPAVRLSIGSNANDFPTPSVGDGLLLVTGGASGDTVLAFAGAGGLPPAPARAPG